MFREVFSSVLNFDGIKLIFSVLFVILLGLVKNLSFMLRFLHSNPLRFSLAILLFSSFFFSCGGSEKKTEGPQGAVVTVTQVIQKTIPQYLEYVAQTEAPVSVEIRARVEGFVQEVSFKEGSEVKEGDLLFVIDPKPYEEKLARAKGVEGGELFESPPGCRTVSPLGEDEGHSSARLR
jgi:hypothetical protein